MKKLISPNHTPPGGWKWKDPTTGFPYNLDYGAGERGLENLLGHVWRYREANMLPTIHQADARKQIENEICKLPGMESRCQDCTACPAVESATTATVPRRTAAQNLSGAAAFVKAATLSVISDGKQGMVSPTLANRRAEICAKCPLNVQPDSQTFTEKFGDAAMLRLIGKRRTEKHEDLFNCVACTCNMRAKVWFSRRIVISSLRDEDKAKMAMQTKNKDGQPMTCWQIKEAS